MVYKLLAIVYKLFSIYILCHNVSVHLVCKCDDILFTGKAHTMEEEY